ncbi:hypothetical protein D3C83_254380 [compost metagenome]
MSAFALGGRAFLLLAPAGLPVFGWVDAAGLQSTLLGAAILAPAVATLAFLLAATVDAPATTQTEG